MPLPEVAKLSGASDSGQFSQPSFSIAVVGQDGHTPNQLTGGRNAGIAPGTVYNYSLNYSPDGNVLSANDAVNGNWSYAYDDFNRLAQASGPGGWPTYLEPREHRWPRCAERSGAYLGLLV
jgi:YD repeat-containing protein